MGEIIAQLSKFPTFCVLTDLNKGIFVTADLEILPQATIPGEQPEHLNVPLSRYIP